MWSDAFLVISCELESFMANANRLFPGATVRVTGVGGGKGGTWGEKVIAILSGSEAPLVSTSDPSEAPGQALGVERRSAVLTADFESAIAAMGWRYVPGKGRPGGRFERSSAD